MHCWCNSCDAELVLYRVVIRGVWCCRCPGAAYSKAEGSIRKFMDLTKLPFLPTPMGKGVVSDDHPLCVAAARAK